MPPLISAETEPGLSAFLGKSNLRQRSALCTKNATYMAKMEFNTGIETLTIFLVSVVAAVHGRALFSLRWKPGGPSRGMGPADLRE